MNKISVKDLINKRITISLVVITIIFFVFFSIFILLLINTKINDKKLYARPLISQLEVYLKNELIKSERKDFQRIFEEIDKKDDYTIHYTKYVSNVKSSFLTDIIPLNYEEKFLGYLVVKYSLEFLYNYLSFGLLFILLILTTLYLALRSPMKIIEKDLLTPIMKTLEIKGKDLASDFKKIQEMKKESQHITELELFQKKLRFLLTRKENMSFFSTIGVMGSRLSHDIKKPFSKIKLVLEDILTGRLSKEELQETKGYLNEDISYVDALLQNMMSLSSDIKLHKENISLPRLLERCLQIVLGKHINNEVEITYDFKHTKMLYADPIQMTRVFVNIIDNAYDAMKNQGHLWIHTKDEKKDKKDLLCITIGNNGPVIPANRVDKIFNLKETSGKRGGAGLGLVSVKHIIDAHKSDVWCTSSEKDGTEFHFLLPLSEKDEEETEISFDYLLKRKKIKKKIPIDNNILKKLHIIYLDDEEFYFKHIEKICNRFSIRHTGFYSKAEFDKALKTLNPDIAFLDLSFDGETYCGYRVIVELLKNYPKCYACIHSSHSAELEEEKAKALGAKRYIEKTLTSDEFEEICAEVCMLKSKGKN